jgi:choline dehydrogenase-like flavoprotein
MSVELTDVVVIGSGYGGAIPAYHLAAGGAKVVVLERGLQLSAKDFAQDLRMGSYTRYLDLVVGDGISAMAGNCVGGSSVVNFAAALRAPTFAFERKGSFGVRQWPSGITRDSMDPWYDVVEATLPVTKLGWSDVSFAGGVFAGACAQAGRTCNPVPVMIDLTRCTNCGWQLNGCRFDAKRSMLLNYLPAAVAHGAQIRPQHEVQYLAPATTAGYRYQVAYNATDTSGAIVGSGVIEAKVVVLGAGALATPVILQRSATTLGAMPFAVGKFFSGNGDHESSFVVHEDKVRTLLGLQRSSTVAYQASHIGKNITSMTFDGLNPNNPEFTRFSLQQVFDTVSTILARASSYDHSWFGVDKKLMRRDWASWLSILAMTEDDNEGVFGPPPPVGAYTRVSAGVAQNALQFRPTANTIRGYTAAVTELRNIMTHNGLSTEVNDWSYDVLGVVTIHPMSSARMGDDPNTSALDCHNELRGYPGIFVTDASAVPASLCVNPAMTVAAVAERAVPGIVRRAQGTGVTVTYAATAPGSATVNSAVMALPEVRQVLV